MYREYIYTLPKANQVSAIKLTMDAAQRYLQIKQFQSKKKVIKSERTSKFHSERAPSSILAGDALYRISQCIICLYIPTPKKNMDVQCNADLDTKQNTEYRFVCMTVTDEKIWWHTEQLWRKH